MTAKKKDSTKEQFKKAKTKKKKPSAKKEQPYTGGGSLCRVPGKSAPTPGWIRKEQW